VTDHDTIEELLAGYALRSLSGPDATKADLLLTEHVPSCGRCRETLEAFGVVAADLALDVTSVPPPDTLLPRLHRELEPVGRRTPGSRRSSGRIVAAAASLVLLVGLGGLAASQLGGGGSTIQSLSKENIQQAIESAKGQGGTTTDLGQARAIWNPGAEEFYVYGDDVPAPATGMVYRLWAVGAETRWIGDFVPEADGMVALKILLDPSTIDSLQVTLEPADSEPNTPGDPAWSSAA
jgi:hypothetical protein